MSLNFPDIDPVAFSIGSFDFMDFTIGPFLIRWYALSYITGFVLGWMYCRHMVAKYLSGRIDHPEQEDIDDLLLWIIVGVILGGRIGYVIFYQSGFYIENPYAILKIWQGGMSFHGGMLGAALAMFAFSVKRRVSYKVLFDLVAASAPIGLFFGRIANFINAELIGRPSNISWAVKFPGGGEIARHPSQIYEALTEGLLLWLIIFISIKYFNALSKKGLVTGLFLSGYGVFRFLVEFFREPDPHIGFVFEFFTLGQMLCLPMIVLGAGFVFFVGKPSGRNKGSSKGQGARRS